MKPVDLNEDRLKLGGEKKVLQPFDYVLSKIEIKNNEYLLIKFGQHMIPHLESIKSIIDQVFKGCGDRVLIYVDGDISFEKVSFKNE